MDEREILSHLKKFRQINYLVISFVKPLLSQFFCEKSVRENFCNFHTVSTTLSSRASRKNRKSLEKFSSNKSLFADATEPHMKSFLYAAAASATP